MCMYIFSIGSYIPDFYMPVKHILSLFLKTLSAHFQSIKHSYAIIFAPQLIIIVWLSLPSGGGLLRFESTL